MATTTLSYFGKVTPEGDINLPKRLRSEVVSAFRGKEIELVVKRKKKNRSSAQNRYYWGVVVPTVLNGFIYAGNDLQEGNAEHLELVHDFLKRRFLPPVTVADANGEAHSLTPTTTNISTSEFMDYMAQIQQFAAEYLRIVIPDPNEQLEFF